MADSEHKGDKGKAEDALHDLSSVKNEGIAYERRDVRISSVIKFGVALAIGTIITLFLMRALFNYFDTRENADKTEPISQVEGLRKQLPPEPRLQGIPKLPEFHENPPAKDLEEYLDKEE